MSAFEVVVILLAGVAAGTINAIVGSGSLVTFPTLLFFGYPPVVANMSNNLGIVGGNVTGVHGYRRELRGTGPILRVVVPACVAGGLVGGLLLLVLPSTIFEVVVPVLIAFGVVLVLLGPWMQRRAAKREAPVAEGRHRAVLAIAIFLTAVYGGYFGAAQGVILVGVLGALLSVDIQVINGIKNLAGLLANLVSAIVFVVVAGDRIAWPVVLAIGIGAMIGGVVGARVGRRLPPLLLRVVIAAVGVVAIVRMTVFA